MVLAAEVVADVATDNYSCQDLVRVTAHLVILATCPPGKTVGLPTNRLTSVGCENPANKFELAVLCGEKSRFGIA